MWLVLGQDGDVEARWLADQLRTRAGRRVELIEAGELVHECRWEHRVGTTGLSSRLVVGDRTVIDSGEVDGVVNRLSWLGAEGFEGASSRDREYATGELFALGLSWLESLGSRVLNQPAGLGLGGAWRTPGQWRALARSAGLPIVPFDSDHPDDVPGEADQTVLLIEGRMVDSSAPAAVGLTARYRERLGELARGCGLDMMEVQLDTGAAVRGVSFLPPLRRYGPPCVDALLAALARRGAPDLAGAR
jgi:hypothetical protein